MGPGRAFAGVERRPFSSPGPSGPCLSRCLPERDLGKGTTTARCYRPAEFPFPLTSETCLTTDISSPASRPSSSSVLVTAASGQEKETWMYEAQGRVTIHLG